MKMIRRRVFPIVLLVIVCISCFCSFAKEGYHIKVNINGLKDTTSILAYYYGNNQYVKDTAYVDSKGFFEFKGDSTLEKGMYMIVLPGQQYFDIIIDNDQFFEINSDIKDISGKLTFKGSAENSAFYEYLRTLKPLSENITELRKIMNELELGTERRESVLKQIKDLEEKAQILQKDFLNDNPKGLFSSVLMAQQVVPVPEPPIKADGTPDRELLYFMFLDEYWKNVDLKDERLLRTPVFHQKLNQFFSSVVIQIPDSIITAADRFIDKTRGNNEMFKYVVWFVMNLSERSNIMGMDAVFVHMAEKYYISGEAFWVSEEQLDRITKRAIAQKPLLIGAVAPDINVFTPDRKTISLHEIESKYLVLYFWDSDCSHCKVVTPKLKEVYSKIQNKGIKVFAVNTEASREDWLNYIEKNKLEWINVHDPVNTSGFREKYDLFAVPIIYVLDKDKKIIAKKINPEQLEELINHYERMNK